MRKKVTFFPLWKNHRKAGGVMLHLAHAAQVDSTRGQWLHADFTRGVTAPAGAEPDFIPQRCQIMRENRR